VTRDRILLFVTLAAAYLTGLKLPPTAVSAVPIDAEIPAAVVSQATTNAADRVVAKARDRATPREPDAKSHDLDLEALKQVCSLLGQPVETCVPGMIRLGRDDRPNPPPAQRPLDIRTLIITLPDPYETALGEEFDSYYNALQRAAQKQGYLLSQFKTPWDREPTASDDRASGPQDQVRVVSDSQEPEPGVVLFRRPSHDNVHGALLVVFLVGELPTKGVHRRAMRMALATADFLNHSLFFDPPDGRQRAVSVLGPSFSGSADSIAWSIIWLRKKDSPVDTKSECAPNGDLNQPTAPTESVAANSSAGLPHKVDGGLQLDVMTGSATGIDEVHFHKIVEQYACVPVSLHSTVISDKDALPNLFGFLKKNLHVESNEVAILKEEGTAYGSIAAPAGSGVLELNFPLHIKELKEKADRLALVQRSRNSLPSWRPEIPLLEDHGEERDIFPILSQAETNTNELQLERTLQIVSERHIRYVLIAATDPLDIVYLTQQLHDWSPNSKVIALSNHLLFLHGSVNAEMRGLLILSTYPELAANQIWTRPYGGIEEPDEFSSDSTEGTFNAATALLQRQEHHEDKGREGNDSMLFAPSEETNLVEYGAPFDLSSSHSKPVLWLTVLGRESTLPVETISSTGRPSTNDVYLGRDVHPPLSWNDQAERTILPWRTLAWIFILDSGCACLAFLIILGGSDGSSRRVGNLYGYLPLTLLKLFGHFPSVRSRALDGEYAAALARRRSWLFNLSIISAAVPLSFVVFLAVADREFPSFPFTNFPDRWAVALWVWCLLTLVLCSVAALLSFQRISGCHSWWVGVVTFGVAVIAAISPLLLSAQDLAASEQFSHHHLFVVLRAFQFTSGVSPLTPTLYAVAAAMVLCYGRLLCSRILVERPLLKISDRCPPLKSFTDEVSLRNLLISKILTPLGDKLAWIQAAPLLALVVALGATSLLRQWPESSMDGRLFDLSFACFSTMVYSAIALGLYQLLNIWLIARSLLRRLYRHPTRKYYALFNQVTGGNGQERINFLSLGPTTNFLAIALERAKNLIALAAENHPSGQSREDHILKDLEDQSPLSSPSQLALGNFISTHDPATAISCGDWQGALEDTWKTEAAMIELGVRLLAPIEPWWGLELKKEGQALDDRARQAAAVLDNAGLLVASSVAGFARNVLPHLQTLAITSTLGSVLMLFASSSYSLFVNANDLLITNWIVVLSCVATTVGVYASINRDRVLSLISGTDPGEITWNTHFIRQLLVHGVVPLVAILGASFPTEFYQMMTQVAGLIGKG
jgi:hypothetical protein